MGVAWIDTVRPEDADEQLQDLYRRVLEPASGGVDHIMQVHSLHPEGLRTHYDLYTAVMRPSRGLRKVEREMIALVVSKINGCHY